MASPHLSVLLILADFFYQFKPKKLPTMFNTPEVVMQGAKRRVVYVGLYELVAILLTTILLKLMSNGGVVESLGLAIAASALAVIWNLIFNSLFERWEASRKKTGRSVKIRVLHAIGFEGGLLLSLIPLVAWWYSISFLQALWMDLGLLVFFLVYTFAFTWVFDRVFGLPASASSHCESI